MTTHLDRRSGQTGFPNRLFPIFASAAETGQPPYECATSTASSMSSHANRFTMSSMCVWRVIELDKRCERSANPVSDGV